MNKLFFICLFLFFSLTSNAFEVGNYLGKNENATCKAILNKNEDKILFKYECILSSGLVIESALYQSYPIGHKTDVVEDDSGRYRVSLLGSEELLEYRIDRLSGEPMTWLEQISQINKGQIHYLIQLGQETKLDINLDLVN